MRYLRLSIYFLLAAVITFCSSSQNSASQKDRTVSKINVTEFLADVPATNQDENQWLYSELIEAAPQSIHDIADMLTASGYGDETKARLGLNGLAKYVSRPDAKSERKLYEQAILDELEADHPRAVNVFLMEQIELTGSNKAVPVLASFIGDGQLHQSAVHALRAINTPQARDILIESIAQTEDSKKVSVIKALGDMEVSSAANSLIPYASSGGELQQTTLYALAKTGNPAAQKAIVSAVEAQSSGSDIPVKSYYLLFAKRLAEEGYNGESSAICLDILSGDYTANVKSSALTTLTNNKGEEATDQLLTAASGSDKWLRSTSLSLIQSHPGWKIWDTLLNDLGGYPPAVQADIITAAGKSGQASLEFLRSYIKNNDQAVRIAATQSLALLEDNKKALPVLLEWLSQTQNQQEINALKTTLLQLPTESLITSVEEELSSVSGAAQIALIEILAERQATGSFDLVLAQLNNTNEHLRLTIYHSLDELATPEDLSEVIQLFSTTQTKEGKAAIQNAVVSISSDIADPAQRTNAVLTGFDEVETAQKIYLYKLLAEIGGEKALAVTAQATKNSDSDIQNTAINALAQWKNTNAISPLFTAFKQAPSSHRLKLLQGYIRLVNQSKYSTGDKIEFLNDAYAEASSTEEKVMIIKGFETMKSTKALQATISHFDASDEAVKEQALRSAAQILHNSNESAGQTLSVLEATESPQNVNKVKQYIKELKQGGQQYENFTALFNGENLSGWIGDTDSYIVKDGQIMSLEGASGNLFTKQKYSDFVLKFEFKLTPGANNGLGIRSPLEGDPAYQAMELQILDNTAEKYANLQPYQYHGSVYGVAPAERGYLNPVGEWNTQEVIADGSRITVKVNGHTILDTDIEEAGRPETIDGKKHPGLLRENGHIGFLGHGHKVAFKNIRVRDLNEYNLSYTSNTDAGSAEEMNLPPENFKALFNGKNLNGWKGLVGNPESRAKMSDEQLAKAQNEANISMRKHWSVRDGVLYFDGKGESLVTQKKYKDFEMLVDWKIEPGGDSGIYLRGAPQVQIWDITEWPQGSGGLYNNKNHRSTPLVAADNNVGEWNTMRIKMIEDKVTVHLNNQLVTPGVVMENYWNRDQPIYPAGQIELQSHHTPLYFKNIFIREIPRKKDLFNGKDLTGWERVGGKAGGWYAENKILSTEGGGKKWKKGTGGGWLSTTETYKDFKLELEYRLPRGGNSGIFLRAPHEGDPAFQGLEVQLLDDNAEQYQGLEPWQYTGSIYDVKAPVKPVNTQAGQWQSIQIIADGPKVKVISNGEVIISSNLINFMDRVDEHPGLKRRSGYIGLQNHNSKVEFRDINITEIE